MLTILMITLTLTGQETAEPVYTLDIPGLGFEYLPAVMSPPVEGTLGEEAGVLSGSPSQHGVEFHIFYWREDLEENTRKDIWLSDRFKDTIPPDLLSSLVISQVEWAEGSTGSSVWETSSVGLVPVLNFNAIDGSGNILGIGRACAIFPEGYSVLFYGIGPRNGEIDVSEEFYRTIAGAYLL